MAIFVSGNGSMRRHLYSNNHNPLSLYLSLYITEFAMAEIRYSLMDTAHPTETVHRIPRKPLKSPQPSEELLLFSPLDQTCSPSKTSSTDVPTSIPSRGFSSHVKDPEQPDSAARFERVQQQSPWHPGFWSRFPVLGVGALVLTVGCMCALNTQRLINKCSQVRWQQLLLLSRAITKSSATGKCRPLFYYPSLRPYRTYFSHLL